MGDSAEDKQSPNASSRPSGDRPITGRSEDAVGRSGFAEQITAEIREAPRDAGFVIAVTGPWGSGKTSVINMAVEPLAAEDSGFRIVRFNPWLFSGTPQLVEHFFAELSGSLQEGQGAGGERRKRIGAALQRYASVIDPFRFVPGVGTAADVGKAVGGFVSGPEGEPSASEQREALDQLLRDHDERLVIVLDDIDRLRDSEIADVMRLVRLVADFPNTIYVLAFEVDRAARALVATPDEIDAGRAYLEKIVQVSHEIPALNRDQISQLLLERLTEATRHIDYRLDAQHWSALYLNFRDFFATLRDVARYCNHVRAPMALLAGEVEAADILALEALRMFEPAVWRQLPASIDGLTTVSDSGLGLSSEREAREQQAEALLNAAKDEDRVKELLLKLFPASATHYGRTSYGSDWLSTWQRERRVAHRSVLNVYLAKQLPPGAVATAVVERAVRSLGSDGALASEVSSLDGPQLRSFLERLEDHEGKFPVPARDAIAAVYAAGRRLPEDTSPFAFRTEIRVTRVVLRMLRGLDPAQRESLVNDAVSSLESLSDRWSLIRLVGYRDGAGSKLVSEELAQQLEAALIQDFLDAGAPALAKETDLAGLIWFASEAAHDQVVAKVRESVPDDQFVVRLIATHYREVRNDFGRHLQLRWDRLSELVGEELLTKRTVEVPTEAVDADDADAVELFGQARRYAADPEMARAEMASLAERYS